MVFCFFSIVRYNSITHVLTAEAPLALGLTKLLSGPLIAVVDMDRTAPKPKKRNYQASVVGDAADAKSSDDAPIFKFPKVCAMTGSTQDKARPPMIAQGKIFSKWPWTMPEKYPRTSKSIQSMQKYSSTHKINTKP